ncbi:unnamed protein product [Porites evermanni]|uniref:SCP domain-containing protein n=1 Tax=Porites evermanni TaxID=104178 RepID=A0ABN8PXW2_9CNID|nr:unnamed protein product [Porites evermanni]
MKLNSGMNGGAMGFAKELARLGDFPGHRPPPGQGENVGVQCRSGSDADLVKAVVESWYKEACAYFKCPQFSGVTGHFTQLVWKESTELGIGFARGTFKGFKDCLWVVGRYRKAGNVMGQLFQNVVKGSFNCGDVCRK